ncbi:hypothetical protein MIMGU_mgv1a017265mg [Erythranthe guttata]|uniref:Uncharacterized protein n=1 Tax=Erythranthe guttata TaxID=4155 RepID=A0A022QXW4_ERYGU|nr:hypothetical protein MIMGU_mgv1a017265mg [Erythranthe guttata]
MLFFLSLNVCVGLEKKTFTRLKKCSRSGLDVWWAGLCCYISSHLNSSTNFLLPVRRCYNIQFAALPFCTLSLFFSLPLKLLRKPRD